MIRIAAVFALMLLLAGLGIRWMQRPVVIASCESPDGEYTLMFCQTEAAAVYGPQKVSLVLKRQGRRIAEKETSLYNDGKALDETNWTVLWRDDAVEVTLHGEEQANETITLALSGSAG